jgi:hypothetical protein
MSMQGFGHIDSAAPGNRRLPMLHHIVIGDQDVVLLTSTLARGNLADFHCCILPYQWHSSTNGRVQKQWGVGQSFFKRILDDFPWTYSEPIRIPQNRRPTRIIVGFMQFYTILCKQCHCVAPFVPEQPVPIGPMAMSEPMFGCRSSRCSRAANWEPKATVECPEILVKIFVWVHIAEFNPPFWTNPNSTVCQHPHYLHPQNSWKTQLLLLKWSFGLQSRFVSVEIIMFVILEHFEPLQHINDKKRQFKDVQVAISRNFLASMQFWDGIGWLTQNFGHVVGQPSIKKPLPCGVKFLHAQLYPQLGLSLFEEPCGNSLCATWSFGKSFNKFS